MKARRKVYDLGNGFRIHAENRRTWTEYTAGQFNDEGFHVKGRLFRSCYRREADAKIAEWKAEDENPGSDLAGARTEPGCDLAVSS